MAISEQKQTAILLFSRTPQEEVNAKELTFRHSRAAVHLLLQHSLRQARKTKLPLYTCYSAQQRGNCFGERLANALEEVFAKGHKEVLVIGNDSPGLNARLLLKAKETLRSKQLVLGPATDGGVYLIGINANIYQRNKFLSLAWETPFLQNSWQTYAKQIKTSPASLSKLDDIDTVKDFWQFVRLSTGGILGKKLKACLYFFNPEKATGDLVFIYLTSLAVAPPPHRGPPILSMH